MNAAGIGKKCRGGSFAAARARSCLRFHPRSFGPLASIHRMRNTMVILLLCWPLVVRAGNAPLANLDHELAALSTDTALVLPSQAIDEYALWSPDCRFLGVNVEGQWKKIDLGVTKLVGGSWRGGQQIGVISNSSAVTPLSASEAAKWRKTNKLHPRRASVGGTVIELKSEELSTELLVTRPARQPEHRWSSDEENCHSLVVAPDARHVAFICEENGMFILKLP
jgi:hypothetical protein